MNKSTARLILLLVLLAGILAFFALDLGRFLTLESLRARQASLRGDYALHPVATAGVFLGAYIASTALSLPGAATILTLAGGAVFGFLPSLLLVSFASTLGATAAFLASRFLFREWVQRRFGNRLAPINRGIEREGAYYLFVLRLVPAYRDPAELTLGKLLVLPFKVQRGWELPGHEARTQ